MKEDLIVDFLRLTIHKYCNVNELPIADYFKMRAEVVNQTGDIVISKHTQTHTHIFTQKNLINSSEINTFKETVLQPLDVERAVKKITDECKNITIPQIGLWAVKLHNVIHPCMQSNQLKIFYCSGKYTG